MLSTGLGEAGILPYVKRATGGKLVVACINSPDITTISGDEAAIESLAKILEAEGVFNRKLKVGTAYHSHHMQVVADDYLASLSGVEHSVPRAGTTFFSIRLNNAFVNNPQWITSVTPVGRFQSQATAEGTGLLSKACAI